MTDESTPLLSTNHTGTLSRDEESNNVSQEQEQKLGSSSVGDRLPYAHYTTIDWLHDLVKDSYRMRRIRNRQGIRFQLFSLFDEASGWLVAALVGAFTAFVAFAVDVVEATVSDWKEGYCKRNPFLDRETCCSSKSQSPLDLLHASLKGQECLEFQAWSDIYASRFATYVAFGILFGLASSSLTMLTRRSLPVAPSSQAKETGPHLAKTMYMAAGSGIPEIKTILSGFVIPGFLSFKVLSVKAMGAVFAVATGMCLGKEGPFVHISACVGWLVANLFPKYRDNGRKMREMLSAACAAGLSVAFGAPIGGVLFSYEEISSYFPRKVLWRAFLCSLTAAIVLKALNPTGTGKLVLFETHYGEASYQAAHFPVFVLLGIAGGVFGGLFCKLNFAWSKRFRAIPLIRNHPVFETVLVVLVTTLLQFPNPLIRDSGDKIVKALLADCRSSTSWVCQHEASSATDAERTNYIFYLIYGTLTKLILTVITFGIKVPSGVIIPALDAGALFGRLVGQFVSTSPGIFAMVGAAAFLAGVSRMTISLGVIMFELTGDLDYVVPNMIAILVAKWVADALGRESVYDLAQTVLGHPFMDCEHAILEVQRHPAQIAQVLVPPEQTMNEITVVVPENNCVTLSLVTKKLDQLRARGLLDAGLVLVRDDGSLLGYLSESELGFFVDGLSPSQSLDVEVCVFSPSNSVAEALGGNSRLDGGDSVEFDLSSFVDRTPFSICTQAPLEYVVEMFGKLGLRYLVLTEEVTGKVVGVVLKKRLVAYLESIS
ncbi:Hypothetical protein R9X50_00239600 [Acrodontium crateriforme]|uniref:Chloride channel protein n=1 Tax=Acrodontium crateriforme TaxID=150365 RepID=A0AAQ3R6L7_9PEZI|nr:Hypothetical protein R9X50_00239600 [Acrodontium crateriforme]